MYINWSTKNAFPTSLTQLVVQQAPKYPGEPFTRIVDTIACLPSLQYLELRNVLSPVPPSESSTSFPTASLPSLHDLVLEECIRYTTAFTSSDFLDCIACPASTAILLDINWTQINPTLLEPLVISLRSKLRGAAGDGANITALELQHSQTRFFQLGKPWLTVTTPSRVVEYIYNTALFSHFPARFPLHDISTLRLEGSFDLHKPTGWRDIMLAMPGVETLHLTDMKIESICGILGGPQGDGQPHLLLPNLKCLQVEKTRSPFEFFDESFFDALTSALILRREAGLRLEDVVVKGSVKTVGEYEVGVGKLKDVISGNVQYVLPEDKKEDVPTSKKDGFDDYPAGDYSRFGDDY